MEERSILICGLHESGKTTFLAALWHLVTAREISTALQFRSLKDGDHVHLNMIAGVWRDAKQQKRTELTSRQIVTMNLKDSSGNPVRVTFPDLSGETYRKMWEDRECDLDVVSILKTGKGVLLFINADHIKDARSVVEEVEQTKALGMEPSVESEQRQWEPRVASTQVKLVDILQMLNSHPLDIGPRRVAVMLSAWDKIIAEERTPDEFLKERMSLLEQYLSSSPGIDSWRVYGVSAQGGDFKATEEVDALKAKDKASTRIRLFFGNDESHDLTEPLLWLMQ